MPEHQRLRILITNERRDRLASLADVVDGLGHDAIAREVEVSDVSAVTARERPDVALVGLGQTSHRTLELIEKIADECACPVIALLWAEDPAFIRSAAERGIFAYIAGIAPDQLQSAIHITLQRFGEYHNLRAAFGRRVAIEQAKGILMARHAIDADRAFGLLRDHSQRSGHKLAHVATALVDSHLLSLPSLAEPRPTEASSVRHQHQLVDRDRSSLRNGR